MGEPEIAIVKVKAERDEDHSLWDVRKNVMILAWPVIIEMILQTTLGICDTKMVGHLGPPAVASVGLGNNIVMLGLTLFAGLSTGTTALVARCIGAGEVRTANRVTLQSLIVGSAFSLVVGIIGFLFAREAMLLMGAQPDVLAIGTEYLQIVMITIVFAFIMQIVGGCLRGAGDTRTPMYVAAVSNALNILGNYILIYGKFGFPAMGVAGAALSTAISRGFGGAVLLWIVVSGRSKLTVNLKCGLALDIPIIKRILNVGIPAAVEQILLRISQLGFSRIVAQLGTVAYAAHSITLNAESISFMPASGVSMAAAALVGQNLGARKPTLAEKSGYESQKIAILIMSVMGLVFFIFSRELIAFFIDDPDVINLGSQCLKLVALSQPSLATVMVLSGALRGAGDTRWMTYISFGGLMGVRVPLAYLLALYFNMGLIGAWIAMSIDLFIRALLAFLRFRSGGWKDIKI